MISTKTAAQIITELNESDETEHVEAKQSSGSSVGKSVFETICAMSNEPGLEGGTILLGVEKEEALFPLYRATGVDDPDKLSADIASGCSSMFNQPVRVNVITEKIGKNIIIRIDVQELPNHQKPLYFVNQGLPRGALRRIGPTDQRCTEADLLAFYQGKESAAADMSVVAEASWDDIDPDAIQAYRKAREEANPAAAELGYSDEELIHALGGMRRIDGKLRVTVAGLIVFGKQSALRRICPSHRVDYIRVPGNQWVKDVSHQFDSVEMRGPLITLVRRVLATILDDLPKAFRFEKGSSEPRKDLPLLPVRAILEATVNCLIHRSYQSFQPIQIVRYANRVEFINPGYSLKSSDRFDDPTSVMRNPHIAEVMHEINLAETKGTGIRRMREFMEESGLSSPTFDSNRDHDIFSAIFLFHHFLNEADWQWLAKFKEFELTDDQRRALIFVREVGAIDNQHYRTLTRTDTLVASRNLRKLRSHNLLSDRGAGNRAYYVPGPELLARTPVNQALGVDSIGSRSNSTDSESSITLDKVPVQLRKSIKSIQLGQRMSPTLAQSVLVGLCSLQPLSGAQIAEILGLNPTYLTQAYLSALVKEGQLQYLHPDQPNHPGQKYIAAGTNKRKEPTR